MSKPTAETSNLSVEHYTPPKWADLFRYTFNGPIHLDPASCLQANTLIKAERFYTQADDGLSKPWSGNVFLNPPGGRIQYQGADHNQSAVWWSTLSWRYHLGLVAQGAFVVFNWELTRYTQAFDVPQPQDFLVCTLKERIDFFKPGPNGIPVPQGSPVRPNAMIYLGPNVDRFREAFGPYGVINPRKGLGYYGS